MEITQHDIKDRLRAFGYTATDADDTAITFTLQKIKTYIKNFCNTKTIPEGLFFVAVDMVCGEFLKVKKASGDLGSFEVDLNLLTLTKQSMGDTSLSFGADKVKSAEERLDTLIEQLLDTDSQLMKFRRLKW